jgi:hypothetical protein
MSVKWYEWENWDSFNSWHDALCQDLGYPWIAEIQATGKENPEAQKVLRYTDGREVDGKIIAIVEPDHAEGLIETQLRPPTPEIYVEPNA